MISGRVGCGEIEVARNKRVTEISAGLTDTLRSKPEVNSAIVLFSDCGAYLRDGCRVGSW